MPNPGLSREKELAVAAELVRGGKSQARIARECGVGAGTVSNIKAQLADGGFDTEALAPADAIESDKKVSEFDWQEWADWIGEGQKLRRKGSASQHTAKIELGDGKRPVILFQLGDLHMGSWGSDHELLRTITKEITETPGLYVALVGDLVEMAIKMRSVLEVMGQILPPEQQLQFLESWLKHIMPKVAFSCWCNHAVEREEKMTGISSVKNLLAAKSVYFNGIGHPDVHVGDQVYKFCVSHKYRGNSMFDATFGPKRYMRMEAHGREIALQGDLHRPAISQYVEGGEPKLAITSGTLQLNSGYAQRYFSLKTFPVFPCIVLRHDRHEAVPFWNLKAAIDYVNGTK